MRDPETGQYAAKEVVKPEDEPAKELAKEPVKAEPANSDAAPKQALTDKEQALLRVAQVERGKRQELERRIAAGEYAKTQPGAPAEALKTFWDDPEAALERQKEEMRQEGMKVRLQTAELIARQRHTDFDEKLAVFSNIVKQTPGLVQQWLSAPDPAEFAYNLGKNHLELQQAGGIPELRAKIKKETEIEVRTKIEAELKDKAEALAKERAALPSSLSDARSTGVNKPVWGGIPSMEEILKG